MNELRVLLEKISLNINEVSTAAQFEADKLRKSYSVVVLDGLDIARVAVDPNFSLIVYQ